MKKSNTSARLKEIIALKNVKQIDIIESTGITKGALSSYISGRYEPKQDKIYILAKYFDISPAWLMGYDVPMQSKPAASAPSSDLSLDPEETRLINTYRSFNKTGKAKLMDYLADLDSSPRNHGEVLDSYTDLTEKDNLA
ncbi:MAG: helix-turn-helix domain-containing protein [Butyrivibrio sp.]|uniref:helix-turn-helix domain-containing protein n=1 Tax=Butyrivibrio sp. TaxID=28121 RepID=UPI001B58E660|nr:helix-turn-helix domain-containing protein [Butyrivibrio sp.]MBP3782521.1 helix-turn-helix domain-containing protein [Butyrivibrio sp.]